MNRGQMIMAGVIAFCVTATSLEGQSNSAAVETTKVVAQVLRKTLTIPGDLTPYQGVNVSARVSGFVESLGRSRIVGKTWSTPGIHFGAGAARPARGGGSQAAGRSRTGGRSAGTRPA